jgi:signal peptidase II
MIYIIGIIAVILGVALDQYTKYLAITHLQGNPIPLIDGVFELRYLENRGAAFGMLQNQRMFFYICVVIIAVFVIWFYQRVPMTNRYLPLRLCSIFVLAGGIGNFIDRVKLNYVVDFFYFELIDFPIFNVADIYVTCSMFALVFFICFYYKEEELDRVFSRRK